MLFHVPARLAAIVARVPAALRPPERHQIALADANGSVVNVNSMVVRHSQAKYGAYKMAKSALLAMSQSLATELGEQGTPLPRVGRARR